MPFNKPTYNQPKQRKQYTLTDNKAFVTAWMTNGTKERVAEIMNMSVAEVTSKASRLRSKGVNLPSFKRSYNEVDELNKIVNKYSK